VTELVECPECGHLFKTQDAGRANVPEWMRLETKQEAKVPVVETCDCARGRADRTAGIATARAKHIRSKGHGKQGRNGDHGCGCDFHADGHRHPHGWGKRRNSHA
jgi:hypothetical protein